MSKVDFPTAPNGQIVALTPDKVALAVTNTSSISSSTAITFNASTQFIRCYAKSQDVFLKWGTTAVTSTNFDEVIPAGQIVDLIVPPDSSGVRHTTCRVIEQATTATLIVIEK